MRKIARRAMTAGAVAATAIALTAVPASAATVTNGGNITGTNVGSIIGFGDINGSTLECTSSTASGSLPSGSVPDTDIATLNSVAFSSPGQVNNWCVANGSIPTQVTAVDPTPSTPGLGWTFDKTPGGTSGGVSPGQLKGVKVTLHAPSVPCDATVGGAGGGGGTIDGAYTNPSTPTGNNGSIGLPFGSPNTLEVLSVSSATDCAGLISLGETVSLAGSYKVVNSSGISPTINN
ncbi:hypothetical protein [Actinomadura sp. GTD37]|uniref:hypothetical protein n=1 Tax=Actinomadura sp. GTD37 TaxID=1778030 RepID=UPI0035C1C3CD